MRLFASECESARRAKKIAWLRWAVAAPPSLGLIQFDHCASPRAPAGSTALGYPWNTLQHIGVSLLLYFGSPCAVSFVRIF